MSATLPPLVLSIQSHVAWGHVGNAAAVFPLQRLGFEVLPIHTVQFSNHTGYGQFRGQVFGAEHVREVLLGLRERGVLPRLSAVLSGYLGDADTGRVILEAVGEIRQHNPAVRYLCDPVMGDVGRGVFVNPAIPDFLRDQAIPFANIITPNQFEFELLTGSKPADLQDAVKIARQLRGRGPDVVIVTSLATPDIPDSELGTLAVNGEGAWLVTTPRLALHPLPNGMGDVFSATLLGRLLAGQALPQALELATATLYALVGQTEDGARDLPLVVAQEQIVAPGKRFVAQSLG
ncbi:pyridoxal kinase [Ectopseudomonas mendocina]|jgi:pyridoxine kinase|uniref:pyridoxal kinase n=1 Tax=Ectopseudomonas mendocina TaxID=300 RepID=A0A379IUW7_ECTME|nr:pyridoxal kinase PdxY [Pseudomonas mendocina]AEB58745.1 pyridoxal kinase [Pseudomonas mendocina NK-01]MDF2075830.1 pyridoxal kinase PdxY [Pseudomonas mendocina]QTN45449.1 pyridoxal kinase PdxY [Pseudomonas mendocina]SUD29193.1 pyridoxal kinase [Pseudomonas mendocina]SUD39861.1 pyridoxal kinase [Pseudomonas mendocina]